MKTLLHKILKTVFVASILFSGAVFADAASFDSNPSGRTGTVSIIEGNCSDCGGQYDSISVNIPNSGDSVYVTVFTDFMAARGNTGVINSAYAVYSTKNTTGSNQSFTFSTTLKGSGVANLSDSTRVTGLPSSYSIDYVSGHVENDHGGVNTTSTGVSYTCHNDYDYKVSINEAETFSSTGQFLGRLTNEGNSWCSQGSVAVKYKITNTTNTNPTSTYSWQTSAWGLCTNNTQTRTVTCINQNNVTVSNSYCTSNQPATTQTCNSDIDSYVWRTGSWGSCINLVQTRTVTCVNQNNVTVSTINCSYQVQPAVTQICNAQGTNNPNVVTKNEDDVARNSAELNGSVDMNDFRNGIVFYAYGQDRNQVQDIDQDYNEFSDIDEDGDDLQVVKVDSNLTSSRSYPEDVYGLEEYERYYFRICVEYDDEDNNETIECGVVKDFRTEEDDNSSNDSEIRTYKVDSINQTSATICGALLDDGGDSNLRTWMEFRRSNSTSWTQTKKEDRGERYYCETVRGLSSNTKYYFRACSDDNCGSEESFVTGGNTIITNEKPLVTTESAYSVSSRSAVLPGFYVPNADQASVWFQYGRTENLDKETQRYTKYGIGGQFTHNFTGLSANQRYCYRAAIQTVNGSAYGSTNCFFTTGGTTIIEKPKVIVVKEAEGPSIDLSTLGLGLSFIRLDIDNNRETVSKGDNVTYEIIWENISDIDLDNLDLNITIPREIQITSSSRGILDQDRNAIFYTIDDLRKGEENSMTVTGIVTNGSLTDALTAEATIAFANPINEAQENATDYDVDEFVLISALGTASVFGLANITPSEFSILLIIKSRSSFNGHLSSPFEMHTKHPLQSFKSISFKKRYSYLKSEYIL